MPSVVDFSNTAGAREEGWEWSQECTQFFARITEEGWKSLSATSGVQLALPFWVCSGHSTALTRITPPRAGAASSFRVVTCLPENAGLPRGSQRHPRPM